MPSKTARPELPKSDVIVVGSGPNGLAAAIRMAQAGRSVVVVEAADQPGGGVRSQELTRPGFIHDVCSSVYPMAVSSPFFKTLPLHEHGLEWIYPLAEVAHPLDDGTAVMLYRSLEETTRNFGLDGENYKALFSDFVARWNELTEDALAPLRIPKHLLFYARFGKLAIRSARSLARAYFKTERVRALFGGIAAHAVLPLEKLGTGGFTLVLAISGHACGWPLARGGAQQLTNALLSLLRSLGGQIVTGYKVESLDELPPARNIFLDITPKQLLKMGGDRLPEFYNQKLRKYRYTMGAFKMDWALDRPVPWRAPECAQAGTIHLGGSFEEISDSERQAWQGKASARPFVLAVQPSIFDPSRAPAGKHTFWAYCHVPNGSQQNMVDAIENQIERFAPGFRDCIIARSVLSPADLEKHNPNLIGGDFSGGAATLDQLFFRPTASMHKTPARGVYLCSSSTPPGGGVHGMCGFYAAEAALAADKK